MKPLSFPFQSPTDDAPIVDAPLRATAAPQDASLQALRRALPDIYFVNTPPERVTRHLEILRRLGSSLGADEEKHLEKHEVPRILDFHVAPGRALTECTFCAFDEGEPGLLAKMCGLMLWLNLRVHTAFIYTLDNGSEKLENGEQPIALNTFLLSERHFGHDRALSDKTLQRLQQEIGGFLDNPSANAQVLSRARRRSLAPLAIHDLRLQNFAHDDESTRLTLSTANNPGILYRTTSALAQLKLNVRAAQISLHDASADDIFFLNDGRGHRLDDAQLSALAAQLRALLEDATSFGPGEV